MLILTWFKDAVLCLIIWSLFISIKSNRKKAFVILGMIFIAVLMGIDL